MVRTGILGLGPLCLVIAMASGVWSDQTQGELNVRISWGHRSPANSAFHVILRGEQVEVADAVGVGLENQERIGDAAVQTQAGGGDVDGMQVRLRYPQTAVKTIEKLNVIWKDLIAQSDPDTARRLRLDPAYRIDPRRLTVQLDREGTRGFAVTIDQLLESKIFWVPALDVFVSAGQSPILFDEHQKELEAWRGKRILEQVAREPEATYEQYTSRWEDMGSPKYVHPNQPSPGHVVCIGWDSGLYKFGIDRGAGVWPDLAGADKARLGFDFGELGRGIAQTWKSQRLLDGLPIIATIFENQQVRFEVEQFAYPLNGAPKERRGDVPMVLMQKVRLTNLEGKARSVAITMGHQRVIEGVAELKEIAGGAYVLEAMGSRGALLAVQGEAIRAASRNVAQEQSGQNKEVSPTKANVVVTVDLPEKGAREVVIKLPSPIVGAKDQEKLLALRYVGAREATIRFWSDYLACGAQFQAPENAVNELFRANLWHALRLPRRHGGAGDEVRLDLPYSNFAYGQNGTPWPVNQAVYVDYMLYDLRGYHDLSAEELRAMYRNNQEANGHVGGYANWGVYTPSMMYVVGKNYLLSGDRGALDRMLPQTLKAMDWCLAEIKRGGERSGASRGLVEAPLNDLTGEGIWAFNQAYLQAGLEMLGRVLERIGHPRAGECVAAAKAFGGAVERGFAAATMRSPLVQLRDHTWSPYVPTEALRPGRMMNQWYPTDVDTGALHLPRLKTLPADSMLTDCLLNDHEDNLFLHGWGMANEPVYNQQATAYLLRDDAKAAIRAFYSMMACGFSHSCFEPVEHRWTWGQYFGPPSTDGAWFELYRNMLIRELDDDTLLLLQASPRKWLEDGKKIAVLRAPTYYGPISMQVQSMAGSAKIVADIEMPTRSQPRAMLVRLRHPEAKPMRAVRVNGRQWKDFDPRKEWVRIADPGERKYTVVAEY